VIHVIAFVLLIVIAAGIPLGHAHEPWKNR